MAYDPYEWKDGEEGETPITAARLNTMEQGIAGAAQTADNASTLEIGTTATTAMAGNTPIPSIDGLATSAELAALAARVTALEDAEAG